MFKRKKIIAVVALALFIMATSVSPATATTTASTTEEISASIQALRAELVGLLNLLMDLYEKKYGNSPTIDNYRNRLASNLGNSGSGGHSIPSSNPANDPRYQSAGAPAPIYGQSMLGGQQSQPGTPVQPLPPLSGSPSLSLNEEGSFESFATAYWPDKWENYPSEEVARREGGFFDRCRREAFSLQRYLGQSTKTRAPYVSVAMDTNSLPYFTQLRIPALEQEFNGGKFIDFRVVDTGGAFQGTGLHRIDIAMEPPYHNTFSRRVKVYVAKLSNLSGQTCPSGLDGKVNQELETYTGSAGSTSFVHQFNLKHGGTRSTGEILEIIVHGTREAYGDPAKDLQSAVDTYNQYGVSAHWAITIDGRAVKLLNEDLIAYHTGTPAGLKALPGVTNQGNRRTIGIELLYDERNGGTPTELQYQSLNELVKRLKEQFPTIKVIETHGDIAERGGRNREQADNQRHDPVNFDRSKIPGMEPEYKAP